MPDDQNDKQPKPSDQKDSEREPFASKADEGGQTAGTQQKRSEKDDEDTAGGREGAFSQDDYPKADDVDTQWSPGSNQSER